MQFLCCLFVLNLGPFVGDAISTSSGESPDHSVRSTQPSKLHSPAKQPGKSEEEIKEEEDFQLALALSKSEAEEKEKMVFKLEFD